MCLQSHQPQMSRWQMGYLRYYENSKWPALLWHLRNRHWGEGWGCRCSKLPDSDSLAVLGEGKPIGSSHHGSKLYASWNHIHNHLETRAVKWPSTLPRLSVTYPLDREPEQTSSWTETESQLLVKSDEHRRCRCQGGLLYFCSVLCPWHDVILAII